MTIVCWGWKEQPDWREINAALSKETRKTIYEVQSDSDICAVVIGARSTREAQNYFGFEQQP
jgi:hypothetical protein